MSRYNKIKNHKNVQINGAILLNNIYHILFLNLDIFEQKVFVITCIHTDEG